MGLQTFSVVKTLVTILSYNLYRHLILMVSVLVELCIHVNKSHRYTVIRSFSQLLRYHLVVNCLYDKYKLRVITLQQSAVEIFSLMVCGNV